MSGHYLLLAVFSCLLRNGSVDVPTYWAVFEGKRYGNVSEEMNGVDISHCSISCMKHNESHPCHAFNFREADGSCQLIRKSKSHIVKSEGYQAYVQFLCLTGYPKIQNAEEAFHGWSGAYPAPRGGQVTFKCKHPRGFTDDHKVHMATCASMRPDAWCTTFTDHQTTILCPPPRLPECKMSQKGGEYAGVKNRTISGFACVPWLDPEGREGDIMVEVREGSFPDEITSSHKFCRNANGYPGGPWCNIKDSLKWEYCDVPFCDFDDSGGSSESGVQSESTRGVMQPNYKECRLTEMGKEYSGKEYKTETGKGCIKWTSVTERAFPLTSFIFSHLPFQDRQNHGLPQKISDFLHHWIASESDNRNRNDFGVCRNFGSKERPWCFVSLANSTWEYCDIPFCPGPNGLQIFHQEAS
ncbi:unnamed protein product [Darwinula stevensoni]|uniref:Plasminogen n=1 Tax=Darwinula stevensoni TaxID=69355 RepID=A0A7R9FRG5_9CRUS|nr:unnamed protein product [Darwinula stevensoni]CAG0901621.1 unnamed protein product [Darwinula stevensoni]